MGGNHSRATAQGQRSPVQATKKIFVELLKKNMRNLEATRYKIRYDTSTNSRRIKMTTTNKLAPKSQLTTLHPSSQFLNEPQPQRPLRTLDR